jgi:hypothetical protein
VSVYPVGPGVLIDDVVKVAPNTLCTEQFSGQFATIFEHTRAPKCRGEAHCVLDLEHWRIAGYVWC